MLIHDTNNRSLHLTNDAKETQREQLRKWVTDAEENCKYIDDPEHDPTNAGKRLGAPLHHDVLEARLKKLNPRLIFVWNSFNSTKKCIFFGDTHIPYEAGIMPERSIMGRKSEEVPIGDVYNTSKFRLERADLRKDGKNPWMKTIQIPWREEVRGWRTVLIKLVACGAISPTQAEVMFSPADNHAWQAGMGKARQIRPF